MGPGARRTDGPPTHPGKNFIKYEAKVSSRVSGGERGVVDFDKLFTETNEQKFS